MATQNKMMRAWAIRAYGEPLELMELPVPEPAVGDVLIRMRGAEVGDWDELVRQGGWPMERPFPLVLGLAGAGTVAASGRDASGFGEGQPVYVYNYPLRDNGAWAQYMLAPAGYLARPPASLDLVQAGSVPIVGLTAHETITDVLDVRAGEVVLMTPGAGGVGHLAVQIAKHARAKVVATASPRSTELVRGLGADSVVDYTRGDVAEAVRKLYPDGVDKILCGLEGDKANRIVRALRPGGRMVDLTGSVTQPLAVAGVQVVSDYVVRANADRLARLTRWFDEGVLKLQVEDVLSFERAPDALARVLSKRVIGKLALEVA